jgi:hypothetical protein
MGRDRHAHARLVRVLAIASPGGNNERNLAGEAGDRHGPTAGAGASSSVQFSLA